MRILVFGASTTQGFYDREGGWVQRLARDYHGQTLQTILSGGDNKVEVFNLGVSGDTAKGIAARFENEVKARRSPDHKTVVVLTAGTNDARQRDNRALVDVYDFQEYIEKILDRAEGLVDGILCVGLAAVNEDLTNPSPYSQNGSQWTNTRINTFEDTLKQCAAHADVAFVPIHDQFLAQLEGGADLLADGLHPNEAGHQLIAELVKPALDSLINRL